MHSDERYEASVELGRHPGRAATTRVMVESDDRAVVAALVDAVKAAYAHYFDGEATP